MGNVSFSMPLVSLIEGNLWSGGTPADVGEAPAYFDYILNLYPWEAYHTSPRTRVKKVELYDAGEIPDVSLLYELAGWVNDKRALGPTLVHCQAGINRSSLVVSLALILGGRVPDEAIAFIRKQRSSACLSNEYFENWLRTQDVGA